MNTIRCLLFLIALGACEAACLARFEPPPVGVVEAVSPAGDAIVRAFPKGSPGGPKTIVLLKTSERTREDWKIHGFFEWARISTKGKTVAVIAWRSVPPETTPSLRLEFYSREGLIRSYALQDLFLSKKKYEELEFMSDLSGPRALLAVEATRLSDFYGSGTDFHLVVGDRTAYEFDGTSGKITSVSYDDCAKSLKDGIDAEDQQQIKRALAAVGEMPRIRTLLGLGTIRSVWLESAACGSAQIGARLSIVIRISGISTPWVDVVVQSATNEDDSSAVQASEVEGVVQKLLGNRGIKELVANKGICGISVTMRPQLAANSANLNEQIASVLGKNVGNCRDDIRIRLVCLSMCDGATTTFYYSDSADLLFAGEARPEEPKEPAGRRGGTRGDRS